MMLVIKKFYLYILLITCISSFNAWGFTIDTEQKNAEHFKGCIPTQSIEQANEPKQIISNNNLTQKVGALSDKLMPKIVLIGRIRDRNCIAIPDSTISIWQTDQYGLYRYVRVIDNNQSIYNMNEQILSNFQGVGSATSTNTGEFAFITVHPSKGRTSRGETISLVVTHDKFPELKTKIFLVDKEKKMPNRHYTPAYSAKTAFNDRLKVYYFDIVLDGKSQHLSY